MGKKQGCKLLHLGGRLNPGDSLESFKCSFGGRSYHYAYLIYIVDPDDSNNSVRYPMLRGHTEEMGRSSIALPKKLSCGNRLATRA
jgi:hypothetical protein